MHLGALIESIEQHFLDAELYFGHGSFEAFDEAAYAALHVLELPLDALDDHCQRPISEAEAARVNVLVNERIATRKPMAYLTHEAWLGPHRFYVDERVLVPRSFIAELLHEELSPWVENPEREMRVLDLCTGSGCLAILAALAFPNAKVDAADLSRDALDVAKKNVADYGLQDRVRLVESDMFAALEGQGYDLIVTNPPYVTGESMRALPEEYLREPVMALASGEDGLDHTRTIIANARRHLSADGLLIIEVGFNRDGVERAFPMLPMTWLEVSAGDGVVFMVEAGGLAAG